MYAPAKSEKSANAFDIGHLFAGQTDVEVWPENWPVWRLFQEMCTQWRSAGMGRIVGLDYGPIFTRLERMKLDDSDYERMFGDIQHIEQEALRCMSNNE